MKLDTRLLLCLSFCFCGALRAQVSDACIACHSDSEFFAEDRLQIVSDFREDVHAGVGLSCHDCHGGNHDPALAEDFAAAMDRDYASNPYRGSPQKSEIPAFCGRCHSDPEYMKRFQPDIRVDQEREYWTSGHGMALRRGDNKVATCIDCHGVHGIKSAGNTHSPVFPTNVALTCAGCHEDADYMKDYKLPSGQKLPVNQLALWQASVHGRAMMQRQDLSAPTCNDCHGNHGATPPGLESISFVCGQCHGREAELFRSSSKREGFRNHNAMLAESDGAGCESCHEMPSGYQRLNAPLHSFTECTTCHGNHGVMRPTVAMLGNLPETPCAFCHEAFPGVDSVGPEPIVVTEHYATLLSELIEEARGSQLEGERRYNWLVDRALELPPHILPGGNDGQPRLRPEFSRLFEKLRIGRTVYTLQSETGETFDHFVVQCSDCHARESETAAAVVASTYLNRTRQLGLLTATGERTLLRARRGGVETRSAVTEIDAAIDHQIELQALVHKFTVAEESEFMKKFASGLEHAEGAQLAGAEALEELSFRRSGLGISLVFIFLVLVGLAIKIRQVG